MVPHRSAREDGVDVEEAAWSVQLPREFWEHFMKKKLTTPEIEKKDALDNVAEQSAFFYCADLFQYYIVNLSLIISV